MPRLPQPGGDKGTWGEVLNEYLSAAHNADGSLKDVPQGKITGLEDALAAKADTSAILGTLRGDPTKEYVIVACVLRNYGGDIGWKDINDIAHPSTFIDAVRVDGDAIRIDYTSAGADSIASFVAVTDDTFAQNGFTVGASVTPQYALVRIGQAYRGVGDYVYYDTASSTWKSLTGVYTPTFDSVTGILTLTHLLTPTTEEAAYDVSITPRGAAYDAVISTTGSPVNGSTLKMSFINPTTRAVITTPDTNCRAYVHHGGGGGVVRDPTTIDITRYPNSNIWVFGILQRSTN